MEERERLSGKKWNYNMRRWKLMGSLMEIDEGDRWGDGEEIDGGMKEMEGRMEEMNEDGGDGR